MVKDSRTFINEELIDEDGEFTILETSRRAKFGERLKNSSTFKHFMSIAVKTTTRQLIAVVSLSYNVSNMTSLN